MSVRIYKQRPLVAAVAAVAVAAVHVRLSPLLLVGPPNVQQQRQRQQQQQQQCATATWGPLAVINIAMSRSKMSHTMLTN